MKRILSCLLVLLALAMMPALAIKANAAETSGSCGDQAIWSYSADTKTLTISGNGAVEQINGYTPWETYAHDIQKIVIGEGITGLGKTLFLNHKNVVEVKFPSTLTSIDIQCFQGCNNLTSVTIPKGVTQIGNTDGNYAPAGVFSGSSLEEIIVEEGSARYYSVDGVLFDKTVNALLCYPQGKSGKSFTVPDSIKTIEYGAFWLNELEEIILPDGLEKINTSAFYASKMKRITIPDSVTSIGDGAFTNCEALTSVTLPAGLKKLGMNTFGSCQSLESIYVRSADCLIPTWRWTLGDGSTIYGYANSTAHAHAQKYGLKFVDIETGEQLVNEAGNDEYFAQLPTPSSVVGPGYAYISSYSEDTMALGGYQGEICLETDTSNETYQEILATVQQLTEGCTTEHEKVQKISEWVNSVMTYQFGLMGNGTYPDGLYWIWKYRVGNCMGYSQLTNFMLYLADISTASITSYDHEWTAAYADGKWIMVDSTNNIFNPAPAEMPEISMITFAVDNNLVCVIDDMTGVKLGSYGLSVLEEDQAKVKEITIPEYVTGIYESAFLMYGEQNDLVIKGTKGSYAEQYLKEKMPEYTISYTGNQFTAVRGSGFSDDPALPVTGIFIDVPPTEYFAPAVEWAMENGITSGTSATTFSPNDPCTRAQVVTFLYRAAGEPAVTSTHNPFWDVPADAYYYNAVLWAVEKGITTGTGDGTTFSPDMVCNRAQVVTFLQRFAGGTASSKANPFMDVPSGAWYTDAVLWAVEKGVTNGTGDGTTFSPDADCTRGQIVTFLYRAMN